MFQTANDKNRTLRAVLGARVIKVERLWTVRVIRPSDFKFLVIHRRTLQSCCSVAFIAEKALSWRINLRLTDVRGFFVRWDWLRTTLIFCIYVPTRLCIFSSALLTVESEMLHVDKADRNNYATFAYAFGCQYAKKLRLIYEYSILIFLYWRGIIFR